MIIYSEGHGVGVTFGERKTDNCKIRNYARLKCYDQIFYAPFLKFQHPGLDDVVMMPGGY